MSYLHSWLYYIIFNDLLMLELFIYLVTIFLFYLVTILELFSFLQGARIS